MMGATAGRTTLNGEGLQHEDGHSLVHASFFPSCRAYDPAFAYETAAIIKDGIARMYGDDPEDVFYYITLYNENHVMPERPAGVSDEAIVSGLYRFAEAPDLGADAPRATILSSGVIMQQALKAQSLLAEQYGVATEVYSAPSFQLLRNEALEVEHWNLHNPTEVKVPYVTKTLEGPGSAGPIVAVSDWITSWPDLISRWVPTKAWRSMGTDGYGRSDTREALRRFFDIDAQHITAAVLVELGKQGALDEKVVTKAVAELDLEPEAPFAIER
ncbi:MAG: pyruvate dehydrogenase (acetyl-transferring), homodimeric type, partial [Candidatus Limnocylindrales bacterium]